MAFEGRVRVERGKVEYLVRNCTNCEDPRKNSVVTGVDGVPVELMGVGDALFIIFHFVHAGCGV